MKVRPKLNVTFVMAPFFQPNKVMPLVKMQTMNAIMTFVLPASRGRFQVNSLKGSLVENSIN